MNQTQNETEIRCGKCNKLLAKGLAYDLTIKCTRCKAYNHVRAGSPSGEDPEFLRRSQHAKKED